MRCIQNIAKSKIKNKANYIFFDNVFRKIGDANNSNNRKLLDKYYF